jgi:hydrogenase maturation factor
MIGLAERRGIVTADGTRAGDAIILTKAAAIEGTAVIAREHARDLAGRMPAPLLRRARQFLRSPGISVGPEATVALRHGAHAMHDPTEGGVLGGLWEMSHCSGLAFHVEPGRIPIYPETRAICDHFGLDPRALLASGSLLLTCPARAVQKMLSALHSAGIPASRIGSAEKGRPGVHLGGGQIMSVPGADEILKVGTSVRPLRPLPHSVVASRWQSRGKHTGGTA